MTVYKTMANQIIQLSTAFENISLFQGMELDIQDKLYIGAPDSEAQFTLVNATPLNRHTPAEEAPSSLYLLVASGQMTFARNVYVDGRTLNQKGIEAHPALQEIFPIVAGNTYDAVFEVKMNHALWTESTAPKRTVNPS